MARRPRYEWNPTAGRYFDRTTGRFVSSLRVRQVIDSVLREDANRVRALAGQVRSGAISREAWAAEMRAIITETHLYSGAAARGGWASMTPAAYGQVGAAVKEQLRYFERFVAEVNAGLTLDGSFQRRASMYVTAGRNTFHRAERQVMKAAGMTEAINVLDPLIPENHCEGPGSCPAETAKGWQPLGAISLPGDRLCKSGCRCVLRYR